MADASQIARRALGLLPRWPWYAWAAVGVGAVALISGGTAAAAAALPGKPAGISPTLRLGSTGAWVKYLQGLLGTTTTGIFDADTDAAVRAFQKAHGLGADGIVGPATWGVLGGGSSQIGPPTPPGPAPSPGPSVVVPAPAPGPAPTGSNPFGLAGGIAERESQILALVSQGHTDHEWYPLAWNAGGHQVSVLVSRRALALSSGSDRTVVNMSFNATQAAADLLGGAMLTTRMSDEIWKQASLRLPILNQNWNTASPVTGMNTSRMMDQSANIDQYVTGAGGLIANEGKDWVLTRRFWLPPGGTGVEKPAGAPGSKHNSANFGWYPGSSKSPGGEGVIQSIGLVHDRNYTDYSQLCRFMNRASLQIDGSHIGYDEALNDPSISAALQDEGGILPGSRHPDLS